MRTFTCIECCPRPRAHAHTSESIALHMPGHIFAVHAPTYFQCLEAGQNWEAGMGSSLSSFFLFLSFFLPPFLFPPFLSFFLSFPLLPHSSQKLVSHPRPGPCKALPWVLSTWGMSPKILGAYMHITAYSMDINNQDLLCIIQGNTGSSFFG